MPMEAIKGLLVLVSPWVRAHVVDMIKSGELSKYPLTVVDSLLEHLRHNIGSGYDIRCDFQTKIKNSLLAARARQCNFQCLVGAFHGHAHNRLCQLCILATYFVELGYLSKSIINNYKQAIDILKKENTLCTWMCEEEILDYSVFHVWLEEEETFLLGLKERSKDQTETLEMSTKYLVVTGEAKKAQAGDAPYTSGVSKAELVRHHAREKVDRDLEAVHELEEKLGILDCWTSESPQWTTTVQQIKQKKYQKALDAVELLVVEHIFELTKINQSQTGKANVEIGYKLRRHIAKVLQASSKAVRNTIDQYNAAAIALDPPMASLTWEQVGKYTFLANFDILRDTRAEVQSRPWTRPAYRLAMDTYFKIEHAREEIIQLNIEIHRMMTWMRDKGHFLREGKTPEQAEEDLLLTEQLPKAHKNEGIHRENLGDTGDVDEMEDGNTEEEEELTRPDDSDDEGIEAYEETLSGLLYQVSMVSIDDRMEPLGDDEYFIAATVPYKPLVQSTFIVT
ncbi:hypothetical protein B0H14DRAFT_2644538 [Mycena olivaceomarginata]|nr:hypothetical protein B0H14DRAFT_2644538 [Mycena olivaceomarginata]